MRDLNDFAKFICCLAVAAALSQPGCISIGKRDKPCTSEPVVFEDVTGKIGLDGAAGLLAWGDYDNDGDEDVMSGNLFFRNNGDGTFSRVELTARGEGVWADFDNDGRLDFLSVGGNGALFRNAGEGKFEAAPFSGNPKPSMPRAACADANNDGRLDLYITNYEVQFGGPINPDAFYLARADGTFEAPVNLMGKWAWAARGANWADFDNDGDQDLYVSNYRLMPNQLWVNDGRGRFEDQAKARGVYGDATAGKEPASPYYPAYEYTGHTIGSCWGDLNNDGNLDLVVVNFSHPPAFQNRAQVAINSGSPDYRFTNINKNAAAGIYWQESYAKGALGDYDNDGDLDLYITTVYAGDRGDLFENDGTGHFKPIGDKMNVRTERSYQVSWADYDNDGDLDLFAGARVFCNGGNRHSWLKVKVIGDADSNRSGIGARVWVIADGRSQVREVSCGNSGNQDPLVQHFGLGDHEGKVQVKVLFPSGRFGTWKTMPRSTFTAMESKARKPLRLNRESIPR
ncbi:MAG: CRTAC1 family protein [Planctomycetota bacterium]|nr:CRTAC1 family protein [Planctomycetota bacterium]MDA1142636.1 CRTAC1 family protein [Planctomycetota bacterium]